MIDKAGIKAGVHLSAWKLFYNELKVDRHVEEQQCNGMIQLSIQRSSFYYCVNFGTIMFLIVCCAISASTINYTNFSNRIDVAINLLLTTVAFKFVMASYVPPTSYLTLLDKYMLLAIVILCLIVCENYLVSTLEYNIAIR